MLIGAGAVDIPPQARDHILDLGFVSVQDKVDAFAAATVSCQPSVNESFSIVIMESWLAETPVLVNGHCAVTKSHCQQANGGLYFNNYLEFAATLDYLFDQPIIARQMGRNGRSYVLDNYQWPTITAKYQELISLVSQSATS